jgi:dipeptidyl-peptidase 4
LWNSQKSGYNHLYLFDMAGKEVRALTSGNWDVIDFKGIDEATGTVYYTSAEESPIEKHVYSVSLDAKKKRKLSTKAGYNDALFSATYKYFINFQSDANTPSYITLHSANGKLIKELETNERVRKELEKFNITPKTFFTFKTERGDELNGWMIKPANFDPNKKYPVIMDVYGGPGSNTVANKWGGHNYMWHQMMAQEGYLIVSVDPRGTIFRGRDFMHSTYLQLGKLETEDMISSAVYLSTLSYVDKNRIGIQGWSYGGYLSSLCMTKGADYFKAGIAIAPVTNWRYYDTIYTERFMRTPQENADGYDDNSPINHVNLLKGKYLLVHGAADDNVHYQNTMEMINALVKANKQFEHFIYPNRNHGIYGGTTRLHLFNMVSDFHKRSL